MSKSKSVEALTDAAWELLTEAIEHGRITLDGIARVVPTDEVIDLAYKLSQAKIKKPQHVTTPEGFTPADTTGEDD